MEKESEGVMEKEKERGPSAISTSHRKRRIMKEKRKKKKSEEERGAHVCTRPPPPPNIHRFGRLSAHHIISHYASTPHHTSSTLRLQHITSSRYLDSSLPSHSQNHPIAHRPPPSTAHHLLHTASQPRPPSSSALTVRFPISFLCCPCDVRVSF